MRWPWRSPKVNQEKNASDPPLKDAVRQAFIDLDCASAWEGQLDSMSEDWFHSILDHADRRGAIFKAFALKTPGYVFFEGIPRVDGKGMVSPIVAKQYLLNVVRLLKQTAEEVITRGHVTCPWCGRPVHIIITR